MALTREFLRRIAKESDVELPKELIDGIITEHISARDAYAEEQVKAAQTSPTESNVKDSEEYKALKKSFDDYKADIAAQEAKAKKVAAYTALLKDSNLSEKGVDKAVKYADWDKIEVDSDGKIKGASDHIKAVREEWAEYVTTTTTTGAKTSTPPANNGNSGVTKEDFQKMSYKDRLQIYNENPDLYNELTT